MKESAVQATGPKKKTSPKPSSYKLSSTSKRTSYSIETPSASTNNGIHNTILCTEHCQKMLTNITAVERSLQQVLEDHRDGIGRYGSISREWGFTTPGGLGGKFGSTSKFAPWEEKLEQCHTFFWPVEAYASMEEQPNYGTVDPEAVRGLPKEAEQLYGNTPLHLFLLLEPTGKGGGVVLEETDYQDYKTAARLFLLLGTLSHLCGNSAPDPKTTPLPLWIEDPLRQLAIRLKVEPTLTGHFLVQENWQWQQQPSNGNVNNDNDNGNIAGEASKPQNNNGRASIPQPSRRHQPQQQPQRNTIQNNTKYGSNKRRDRAILQTLLNQTEIADRRFRMKIYPSAFVGSQAVDVLVDSPLGFADTRVQAVRIIRRINKLYKVFGHVTNDHLLMDKFLFYRFNTKWRNKVGNSILVEGSSNDEERRSEDKSSVSDNDSSLDEEEVEKDLRKSRSRLITPKDIFKFKGSSRRKLSSGTLGSSATSDRLNSSSNNNNNNSQNQSRSNSAQSISLESAFQGLQGILSSTRSVSSNDDSAMTDYAEDKNEVDGKGTQSLLPESQQQQQQQRGSVLECSEHGTDQQPSSLNESSLHENMTAIAIMGMVPVKDRRYHFRSYKQSFVGSQLIDTLLKHECARSRKEALELGIELNRQFLLYDHVCKNHQLKDEYLFYRFTDRFWQMIQASRGDNTIPEVISGPLTAPSPTSTQHLRYLDQNQRPRLPRLSASDNNTFHSGSSIGTATSFDVHFGTEEQDEFRFDNIGMLYPAFGNNHERVNQTIPACMAYALRSLPFLILDILTTMRNILELEHGGAQADEVDGYEFQRLSSLLYQVASSVARCKEQFQLMSTDPTKSTFNSKHISIRQTQPLSNGVLVRRKEGGDPLPSKGTTGTQFPYFHLLDWLLGRFQFGDSKEGLVAKIASVDNTFPLPQREYITALSKLEKSSTLRSFVETIGCPAHILTAYNRLVENYAGEGGFLQAHCRKLYSYIHNDMQSSTSGTNHVESSGRCQMSAAHSNHQFANVMFQHMSSAADERWRLRLPPLMTEVKKVVYSSSVSGGFTTVALDFPDIGMIYEYGDVVKVLLPNKQKTSCAWGISLASTTEKMNFRLEDIKAFQKDLNNDTGWGWDELWESLGWLDYENDGGDGVPLEKLAPYIEQAQILDESNRPRWISCPLNLVGASERMFANPPKIQRNRIASLEPVSPRIYSVSGVEADRVFLLVSKPQDGAKHHGYECMADAEIEQVHCSFTPATFFLVPPKNANLVCVASGTGISPFVGLADAIGARSGSYTIAHQCKSSDLFLANSQTWLDFTAINPGACVMGYISGDKSRRNCPMRYIIRNGAFEETSVLGRHSSSAYYFECDMFESRLREVYKCEGANLAYCCGGVKSAIDPFKRATEKCSMIFEYTCECYAVDATLDENNAACQIGGTLVNLDHVSPIHPGGNQILYQINDVALEGAPSNVPGCPVSTIPDHSAAFWRLHPHAYNLHRCLRSPVDVDCEAFASFLQRQVMSNSVIRNMAAKYAEVALTSPADSKVVRIASELQSATIRRQVSSGDRIGAQKSARYLMALLDHVPINDSNARRWSQSLEQFQESFGNN